jgi:transposase
VKGRRGLGSVCEILLRCHGSGYEIAFGSPKLIASGSAKEIAAGSAKLIADHWTDVSVAADAAAMTAKRTDMHRLQELVRLHRLDTGAREVARLLGLSPNTERRYREALTAAGVLAGSVEAIPALEELKAAVLRHAPPAVPHQQQSSLVCFQERISALLAAGLGPTAIYDRLRSEDLEFRGSIGAVKRLVARLQRERGPRQEDVAIPVITGAGEIAQVDFGYVGHLWDPASGRLRKAWVFVMVLAHSRHQFARVAFDQRTETWISLHEQAFASFGGVPRTVVPDNLKAAVIQAAFGPSDPSPALNRSYRELAQYYGFKVDPAPPAAPQKKGKVESAVKYVKNNALKGRDGESIGDVNQYLDHWTLEIAGTRHHGTTGRKPMEVFEREERAALMPLPARPYEPVTWKKASVHQDSHVVFDRRMYSVPWRLIGREVWVRATPTTVAIYCDDEREATHRRLGETAWSTEESHLPAQRAALRHRSRSYWEERAEKIGADVVELVRELFDSDDVLSQLRQVQAIVTHLEKFPRERALAACRRAGFYGNVSYRAIKTILTKALDLEPLPQATQQTLWAEAPRFARSARTWAETEVSHERH